MSALRLIMLIPRARELLSFADKSSNPSLQTYIMFKTGGRLP
jgi:hypothetical protein